MCRDPTLGVKVPDRGKGLTPVERKVRATSSLLIESPTARRPARSRRTGSATQARSARLEVVEVVMVNMGTFVCANEAITAARAVRVNIPSGHASRCVGHVVGRVTGCNM
jgi:hypothetical protein